MIRRKTQAELILSLKRWGMRCKFNLYGANLYGVDLWIFKTTKHRCIFVPWQNIMKIGCHEHSIEYWLDHYREIGKKEGYTPNEIEQYGQFIRMCGNMKKEEVRG